MTGEHGIGYELRDALEMELGEAAIGMMRKVSRWSPQDMGMRSHDILGVK